MIGYFAHQPKRIAFRIVEETHPQVEVIHPGNQMRFTFNHNPAGTEQFVL
jgi:hypothetical protein